jgi:hypothetical protein
MCKNGFLEYGGFVQGVPNRADHAAGHRTEAKRLRSRLDCRNRRGLRAAILAGRNRSAKGHSGIHDKETGHEQAMDS